MSTKSQAITHFNDGGKLYKVDLFNEALEQYEKALENDPTFHDAHFCLAKTLIRLKKYDDGISHFSKYVHLIPKEKQGNYILALSNILIDEHQQGKALSLVESLNISFTEKQTFDYVPILISNNKVYDAIDKILQIKNADFVAKEYKALLENKSFTESTINKFCKDNIIPRFYLAQKKIELIHKLGIQNKELKQKIDDSVALVKIIRTEKRVDYASKIEELDEKIVQAQNIVLQHGYTILKTKNISSSKKVLSVLVSTKYDTKKTQEFANEIKAIEKKNTSSTIKKVSIIGGVILFISLASYFGYNTYQKSEAYDKAISSQNLNEYNYYLRKFGDKEDIHKLREEKLYEIALQSNKSNDIQSLVSLYSNSEKLRTITFNNLNENVNFDFFGVNSFDDNLHGTKQSNSFIYKIPLGCKVGYRINQYGKLPIEKFFTVNQNLNIKEELLESETLLLDENFKNNQNKWNVYRKMNKSKFHYKSVQSEISLFDNKLKFNNEVGSKSLVYSLIDINGFNKNIDFKITARVKTGKYFNKGTYLMFGASNRAFLYFGYSGTAVNGSYAIGHNNWDDSNNNWKNWTDSWQGVSDTGYEVTLKVEKKNNRLFYYINNTLYKEYSAKSLYGRKIGFGVNAGTKSSISYLKVERINKSKKVDFKKNTTYFCWVNELNVRSSGSKYGEILTTIKLAEPVKYLGEKGKKPLNATFKDIFKPDYYYKVELLDGTIGWVHGGALCEINSPEKIEFTQFKEMNTQKENYNQ
ncbi:MAG: SH3 domain-containing protein [bacterium]|nr:SH3 domain-containing protein [bacterium]